MSKVTTSAIKPLNLAALSGISILMRGKYAANYIPFSIPQIVESVYPVENLTATDIARVLLAAALTLSNLLFVSFFSFFYRKSISIILGSGKPP